MTSSINRIRASDGSGNASQATIQTIRAINATTIAVDTVAGMPSASNGFYATMGTPHTFTDPVTNEVFTVISEATAVDFQGHVNVGTIVIDAIAPGYSDLGSKVGDIVIIRPSTPYANNVADTMAVSHNDDGTIKNGAISSAAMFATKLNPETRALDDIFDHVAGTGCVLAGTGYGSTLGWSLSAGVVYINGKRLTYAGGTGSVTATKDTYFDLLDNGDGTAVLVNTGVNIATVNAASPALAANSIRVGIIQSGVNIADVAHVNQGQVDKVFPIASSIPYTHTDSLGNIICPRDFKRRVLGYRQIINSPTFAAGQAQITGLSVPFISDGITPVLITTAGGSISDSAGGTGVQVIWDGAVGGTQLNSATVGFAGAGTYSTFSPAWRGVLSAGLHTINLSQAHGGGTTTITCAPTAPRYLMVERG